MKSAKHLLIDLDGTLLGSNSFALQNGFIVELIRALRMERPEVGIWRSLKALRAMRVSLEAETADTQIFNEVRAYRAFGQALGVPESESREILHRVVNHAFPKLYPHFFPIEGAREFLQWAEQRFTLHLATNPVWPRRIVDLRLRWAGIDPSVFGFVASAEVMHACKPKLEYYHELLRILGVSASECVMIGDSFRKDLPAVRLGIPVFLLTRDRECRQIEPGAWKGDFFALRSFLEPK